MYLDELQLSGTVVFYHAPDVSILLLGARKWLDGLPE